MGNVRNIIDISNIIDTLAENFKGANVVPLLSRSAIG